MRFLVPELVSNTNGCFSKFTSFVEIDSDLDAYSRIQSLDNRRGEQMMAGKKFDTGGLAAKRGQAIKESLFLTFLFRHHESFSNFARPIVLRDFEFVLNTSEQILQARTLLGPRTQPRMLGPSQLYIRNVGDSCRRPKIKCRL